MTAAEFIAHTDEIMTTDDVAAFLRVSKSTVRGWRMRRLNGDPDAGPRFYKIPGGQCRYRRSEVDEWFRALVTEA